MRVIFPQKWDAQYPSKDIAALSMQEWALGISDLTNDQLSRGVEKTRNTCQWPPSIAEFRELCLGDEQNWMYKAIEVNEKQKRLPNKKASPEVMAEQREKLRKLGIKV